MNQVEDEKPTLKNGASTFATISDEEGYGRTRGWSVAQRSIHTLRNVECIGGIEFRVLVACRMEVDKPMVEKKKSTSRKASKVT